MSDIHSQAFAAAFAILDHCDHSRKTHEFSNPDGSSLWTCQECSNAYHQAWKAARKAQLDAMPRCEIPGCSRRATYSAFSVGMCGFHLNKAQRAHQKAMLTGAGGMGLFMPCPTYNREQLIQMARSK